MAHCIHCGVEVADEGRFCHACGTATTIRPPTGGGAEGTSVTMTRAVSGSSSGPRSGAPNGPRFIPGAVIAGRYRIAGLLGRGGMGEVYRADDLKLGQSVALKFLPPGLDRDPGRLQHFLDEVRTARKVTHPNVCRVYDIGEVDGQHFLSMEYVDGEDLASLLRRIGRLPHERAVEVARQICGALAATHEQGVLHRDLKPANVMIDGRGHVRLTDFGLASVAQDEHDTKRGAGTPAYMAPEQLEGGDASTRSDIYALGLVLYEVFTGKAAFSADSVAELRRLHASTAPSNPSDHIQDLDPAVELVVLRCLEKHPESRPASVSAVAAALPGGDPLAAALAAGQTPSPELLAEVGTRDAVRPGVAVLLALSALVLIVGAARWAGTMTSLNYLPLDKRPEVLIDRARSMLDELGFDEPVYTEPVDTAWGLSPWTAVVTEIEESDKSPDRWEALRNRPDAAAFWYRQAPSVLEPQAVVDGPLLFRGSVTMVNPTPTLAGEVTVVLDLHGNLTRLEVLPKRFSTRQSAEADWDPLFEMAGLDRSRFTESRPRYQRFFSPDLRRAWVGTDEDHPDLELFVEAGSFEGRPALFNVAPLATMEGLQEDPEPRRRGVSGLISDASQPLIALAIVLFAGTLAVRNVRQGRADRRSAIRFSVLMFSLMFVTAALDSHLMSTTYWSGEIWPLISGSLFIGAISWGLYVAAEPLGRQIWPTMFVPISRLLSRPRIQWRDPLIGLSVLVGLLFGGVIFAFESPIRWFVEGKIAGAPPLLGYYYGILGSLRHAVSNVFEISTTIAMSMLSIVALLVLRRAVRNRAVATILAVIVWSLLSGAGSLKGFGFDVLVSSVLMVVLLRWGVVAMVTAQIVVGLAWTSRALELSAWYAEPTRIALFAILALAAYGVWAATGGSRPDGPPTA